MSTLDTTQTAARKAADQSTQTAKNSADRLVQTVDGIAHSADGAVGQVAAGARGVAQEASEAVTALGRRARKQSAATAKQTRRRARRQAKRVNRQANKKLNSILSDAGTAFEHAADAVSQAVPAVRTEKSRRGRFVYTVAAVSALIGIAVVLRQRLSGGSPASVRLAPPSPGLTPDVATQGTTQAPIVERS